MMEYREAEKILRGDFTEIEIPDGKTHADMFSEAFNLAIDGLVLLDSIKTAKVWDEKRFGKEIEPILLDIDCSVVDRMNAEDRLWEVLTNDDY